MQVPRPAFTSLMLESCCSTMILLSVVAQHSYFLLRTCNFALPCFMRQTRTTILAAFSLARINRRACASFLAFLALKGSRRFMAYFVVLINQRVEQLLDKRPCKQTVSWSKRLLQGLGEVRSSSAWTIWCSFCYSAVTIASQVYSWPTSRWRTRLSSLQRTPQTKSYRAFCVHCNILPETPLYHPRRSLQRGVRFYCHSLSHLPQGSKPKKLVSHLNGKFPYRSVEQLNGGILKVAALLALIGQTDLEKEVGRTLFAFEVRDGGGPMQGQGCYD